MEDGSLEEMLYNDFIEMDMIDDIVSLFDFQKLGLVPDIARTVLRNIDYQFYDIDIPKPGFLIKVFKLNFDQCLEKTIYDYEIESIINTVFRHLADNPLLIKSVRDFNETEDDLKTQKCWITLHPTADAVFEQVEEANQAKRKVLDKRVQEAKKKAATTDDLNALVKVFPSNDSDKLTYSDPRNLRSTGTIELPLRPVFKSLYTIASATYELIKKAKKTKKDDQEEKNEKTNIVTGMLSFVISVETPTRGKPSCFFVNVPLTLDYPTILLSYDAKDKVFQDEDDFQRSVGSDRQLGGVIVGKLPTVDIPSKTKEAKSTITRYLDILDIPQDKLKEINKILETAPVVKPLTLEFYAKKDVQKSTEFFHSERVVLHALKQLQNISKIVEHLKAEALKKAAELGFSPPFIISAANLMLYSYPNSVCNECSLGFIAFQNSSTEGFLRNLIEIINQSGSFFKIATIEENGAIRPNVLELNVIAGSYRIFSNDVSGAFIKQDPGAKLDFQGIYPSFQQSNAIVIGRKVEGPKKFFYEFTESNVHDSTTALVFSGNIAMSGSKEKKLPSTNLEKPIKDAISAFNQSLLTSTSSKSADTSKPTSSLGASQVVASASTQSNVVSFSKGHQLAKKTESQQVTQKGKRKVSSKHL